MLLMVKNNRKITNAFAWIVEAILNNLWGELRVDKTKI